MKKTSFFFFILTSLFFIFPQQIFSATPTDTPISSSSTEITNSVVEKIKDVVKNNPSPTLNQQRLLGLVGTVKSINTETLTLLSKNNSTLQIATDKTSILVSGSKSIKLSDIPVGAKIIVIGHYLNSEDIVFAKRLILVPKSELTTTRSTVFGTIISVNSKTKTITLTTSENKSADILISTKSTPGLKDFSPDQKLFAIITTDSKDNTSTLLKGKIIE